MLSNTTSRLVFLLLFHYYYSFFFSRAVFISFFLFICSYISRACFSNANWNDCSYCFFFLHFFDVVVVGIFFFFLQTNTILRFVCLSQCVCYTCYLYILKVHNFLIVRLHQFRFVSIFFTLSWMQALVFPMFRRISSGEIITYWWRQGPLSNADAR